MRNATLSSRRRAALVGINVTPLVDVLLILVAILLLIMPWAVKRLPVTLPDTTLEATFLAKTRTQVVIDAKGDITLDGKAVLPGELTNTIKAGASVEIAADKEVKYARVAQVVDSVNQANPGEIQLIVN